MKNKSFLLVVVLVLVSPVALCDTSGTPLLQSRSLWGDILNYWPIIALTLTIAVNIGVTIYSVVHQRRYHKKNRRRQRQIHKDNKRFQSTMQEESRKREEQSNKDNKNFQNDLQRQGRELQSTIAAETRRVQLLNEARIAIMKATDDLSVWFTETTIKIHESASANVASASPPFPITLHRNKNMHRIWFREVQKYAPLIFPNCMKTFHTLNKNSVALVIKIDKQWKAIHAKHMATNDITSLESDILNHVKRLENLSSVFSRRVLSDIIGEKSVVSKTSIGQEDLESE